ncbi:female-specific protein transformer [Stomoxys calcitrans]|uniref:female-specific protein transformer n=1 Tax=Stomoxys calcitrans TaxID=35570 RepID=UPI0027E2A056|nr:female-specific protein transformer [Stomoxys calcitrans]
MSSLKPPESKPSKVIIKFQPEEPEQPLKHAIKIIQQASDAEKKTPNIIVRSIDLSQGIAITRRYGEGAKPLFERDDVKVNAISDAQSAEKGTITCIDLSSPKRSCQETVKKESHKTSEKKGDERGSKANDDPHKKKDLPHELQSESVKKHKVPYFSDPVRERDRLRRLYGSPAKQKSRSHTPPHSRRQASTGRYLHDSPTRRRSRSRHKHRSRSSQRIRSRSRGHSSYRGHSPSRHSSYRDHFPYRGHSPYRDRSSHRSRSRDRTRSPHRSYSSHKKHSPSRSHRDRTDRSRRRSRTRSPEHERSRHSNYTRRSRDVDRSRHEDNRIDDSNRLMPSTPYIPIPVGVPDFSYPYYGAPPMWTQYPPHRGGRFFSPSPTNLQWFASWCPVCSHACSCFSCSSVT